MEEKPSPHPIALAIDTFLHSVRDIEAAAKMFVPIGHKIILKRYNDAIAVMQLSSEEIDSEDDQKRTRAQVKLDQQFSRIERLNNTKLPYHLERSLFIGLFSTYDAFIGELLKAIFSKRPSLLQKIGKSIELSSIVSASDLEELKTQALEEYIEDFRRDGYAKQFKALEHFFDMPLSKFDSYPDFIESSQRRHLFTHCNGLVSQQYIDCCKEAGYKHNGGIPKRADSLEIGPTYFYKACDILFEVGLKLAHTLWRKQFPDEIEEADRVLSESTFELLKNEKWKRAIMAGEFAYSQKKHSNKERSKIITANYCIALKFGGFEEKAQKLLNGEDWTDAMLDFRLAKAVLLDDLKEAVKLMDSIGKGSELITEHSYHTWPLFRTFRSSDEFRKTYEKIYGYSFAQEIRKEVQKSQDDVPRIEGSDTEPDGGDND